MSLPTIDLCKTELKPGSDEWDKTKEQVVEALQEYGCFEAIYKLPDGSKEAMFDTSKEIFGFPLEIKLKNMSKKPFQGYAGQIPHLPLYESVCIPDLLKPQSVEDFSNIFWPHGNITFCNLVKSYSNPLVDLDEMVKRMVLESLGLKQYNDEFLDARYFLFRLTHYKAHQDTNKTGLAAHTDATFLSILSQNQVNGLQILNKSGEWIDVNVSPNSFLVLSGDSFMAWTNGRLHSPVHRVTIAGDNDRLSIQLFSLPKSDYMVKAPKEVVIGGYPLLFKPYEIHGYLEYVASEAGQTTPMGEVLKSYCGV